MKDRLLKILLALPEPVSRLLYSAFRSYVRPDPRASHFDLAFTEVASQGIAGDYLEFGVYRGSSFVTAYRSAKRHELHGIRFFAFDSFEGLPDGEGDVHTKGEYECQEAVFKGIVSKAGVPKETVETVAGFYDQTLNANTKSDRGLRKAAVVYVDCNLYVSTKLVLEFIEDLVDVGTILMFDDWHVFGRDNGDFGEVKAFSEWRLKDCFEQFYDTQGQEKGFVMTRPASRRAA